MGGTARLLINVVAPLVLGLLLAVWWYGFSRLWRSMKWSGVAGLLSGVAVLYPFMDPTMWLALLVYGLPVTAAAGAIGVAGARSLSPRTRERVLIVALFAG